MPVDLCNCCENILEDPWVIDTLSELYTKCSSEFISWVKKQRKLNDYGDLYHNLDSWIKMNKSKREAWKIWRK